MTGNRWNFDVWGSEDSQWSHDIGTSNTVDGKPIWYVRNVNGSIYGTSTNAGAFYAINCSNLVIEDLNLSNTLSGVFLWQTHDSTIRNVTTSNCGRGIYLYNSTACTMTGNTGSEHYDCTIMLENCTGCTVTGNIALGHTPGYGIWLLGASDCTLTGNTASNNGFYGFFLMGATGCTLTGNSISNNGFGGFGTGLVLIGSNCQVYNNNFIGNPTQVEMWWGSDNVFNLAKPMGGNYWDDHTGPDADGDGFFDNPHESWGAFDEHPWTVPITPQAMIERLVAHVETLNLQQGIDNSLDAKLDAALNALDDINQNNDVAANNSLNAFINAVEAQSGNKIPATDADTLIAATQAIINLLNAG
jgi:parallel beta-helix repeat protein